MKAIHCTGTFRAGLDARHGVAVVALLSAACGAPSGGNQDQSFYLTEAKDEDASSSVVAVSLRAQQSDHDLLPGQRTTLETYSGSLPGPLIRAKRGDTLRVHFDNELDEPTTIHWHGLRIPNAMDGVPGMTQPLVAPHESFDYTFTLPDAGLFWYHPHNDTVSAMGAGLYGALLVTDPNDPPDLGDDVVLVLSDVSVDESGALIPPASDLQTLLTGNEGNVLLVNGKVYPTLRVTPGQRQRWHILNAARSRYFQIGIAGHKFLQIGTNSGLDEYPVEVEAPLLVPGERLDLLVTPTGQPGTTVDVNSLPYSRARPLPKTPEQALFRLEFTNDSQPPPTPMPTMSSPLTAIDTTNAERVAIDLTMNDEQGNVQWGINGAAFNEDAAIMANVGTTQVFVVENKSPYAHPFHFHGFFFQMLDDAGAPAHPLAQRDTIDIPPLSRRLFAVNYDDRPGMWMFHCHILDHAENGMMGMVHLQHAH